MRRDVGKGGLFYFTRNEDFRAKGRSWRSPGLISCFCLLCVGPRHRKDSAACDRERFYLDQVKGS